MSIDKNPVKRSYGRLSTLSPRAAFRGLLRTPLPACRNKKTFQVALRGLHTAAYRHLLRKWLTAVRHERNTLSRLKVFLHVLVAEAGLEPATSGL